MVSRSYNDPPTSVFLPALTLSTGIKKVDLWTYFAGPGLSHLLLLCRDIIVKLGSLEAQQRSTEMTELENALKFIMSGIFAPP